MRRYKWGVALFFIAGLICWTGWEPKQPAKLLKAIPSFAKMVSAHDALVDRIPEALSNPLVESILSGMDIQSDDVEALLNDPLSARLLRFALSDTLYCGYIPDYGTYGVGTWIIIDSLGSKAIWARHLLNYVDIPGMTIDGVYEGYILYSLSNAEQQRIAQFCIVENGVIACISPDANALRYALNGYLGLNGQGSDESSFITQIAGRDRVDAPDRIWLQKGWCFPSTSTLFGLTDVAGDQLCGVALTPMQMPPPAANAGETDWKTRLFDGGPHAYTEMTDEILFGLLNYYLPPDALDGINPLREQLRGWTALALYGDEQSGRYFRLKLPVLVAGSAIQSRDAVLQAIRSYIDALNARYRWGIIVAPSGKEAGMDLYAIAGTTENQYGSRPKAEQVGFALSETALYLSTNLESLRKILKQSEPVEFAMSMPREMHTKINGASLGSLWFDLEHGGTALRLALTGYSLALLMDNAGGTLALRQQINEIKAWIDALAVLQQLVVGVYADGAMLRIEFDASAPRH